MPTEKAEIINCQAGERLFLEGDSGDRAYLVVSGRMEISKKVGGGETTVLAVVGKGEIIGEMALLDNTPRMATARAVEPTVLAIVTRQQFQAKVEGMDQVTRHLIRKFVGIIRAQADELAVLRKVVR